MMLSYVELEIVNYYYTQAARLSFSVRKYVTANHSSSATVFGETALLYLHACQPHMHSIPIIIKSKLKYQARLTGLWPQNCTLLKMAL